MRDESWMKRSPVSMSARNSGGGTAPMNDQLSLFGRDPEPKGSPRHRLPGAAPVDESVRHVAAACPAGLRLGTASWDFPGWAGFVYDTPYDKALLAREGLRAYARHPLMRAVSLEHFDDADMTPDTFRRVADQVPDDFRFVVKAPAVVTMPGGTSVAAPVDNPRYLDGDFARKRFVEPALAGLGEKCGPLLSHFPAQGRRVTRMARTFAVRLAAFLSALSPAPQCVVELLDPELWIDETLAALRDHGARPCLSLHPRAPSLDRQRAMLAGFPPGPLTVRWNLHPRMRDDEARRAFEPFDRLRAEDPPNRRVLADLVREALAQGRAVTLIADNRAEGCAPLSLLRLAEALRGDGGQDASSSG